MKIPRQERKLASPGMIPLMDVMFLVMAAFIFNIHGMKVTHSLPLDLPKSGQAESDKKESYNVTIDASGEVFVGKTAVALDALKADLSGHLAADPALRVMISGDESSPYGVIVSVLDIARELRVTDLVLETVKKK